MDKNRKFWHLFLLNYWPLMTKIHFWGKSRHCFVSTTNFEALPLYSSLLRSWVFSHWAILEVKVHGRIKSVLEIYKISNHYVRDILKIFLLIMSLIVVWFKFLKKVLFRPRIGNPIKRPLATRMDSQTWEIELIEHC